MQRLFVDKPVVIHLSGQPGVRGSFGDGFQRYVHDNILATQRVFDAAHVAGCRRVVYASSSSVYGDASVYPCRESSTPTLPRSPYGVTKRTCEKLAEVYRALGLETVGLRYFTVYGPRQRPDMAIRRLCEAATGGERFRLNGDGEQSRDFTYVEDAVDATIRAATTDDPGDLLNVGGGHEATMNEVIELIGQLSGAPVPLTVGRVQPGDVRRTGSDTTRARRRLGWAPRTDLADGLRAELAWVRAQHAARAADLDGDSATSSPSDLELALGRAS
jgi:nucleoside-diphosphate-sugar epimerase